MLRKQGTCCLCMQRHKRYNEVPAVRMCASYHTSCLQRSWWPELQRTVYTKFEDTYEDIFTVSTESWHNAALCPVRSRPMSKFLQREINGVARRPEDFEEHL